MRVALDAPAGAALPALVAGAARAAAGGLEVELAGPADALKAELAKVAPAPGVSVVDAPGVLSPEDDPQAACREKHDTGLMRAAEAVAARRAEAFVTAAAPSAAVAAALWHVKRLRGVLKPALAQPFEAGGRPCVLVDAGACLDCKPWHLLQFALMGSLYAKRLLGAADPEVRLLASGQGPSLGGELARETVPLLKYAGVRFSGPVGPAEAVSGGQDVLVCDGFTGSVLSASAPVLMDSGFQMLESRLAGGVVSRAARRLADESFSSARARAASSWGPAAALLGVGGAAVVCRPFDGASTVAGALLSAKSLAESGLGAEIQARLEDMKSGMEFARTID